jgi:ABC-type nitrate/sulfonate/bicarbonate transport system substrate-binding protein
MFERAGLDIELFHTSSGSAAVAAVIAGTYQIAGAGFISILSAHLRGIPLVVVAAENMHSARNPLGLLQVANDSTAKTAADLNGRLIGVPSLNDLNSLSLKAWADEHGGDWRSLKFVEIPNSVLIAALQQHRVDAAVVQYPALSVSLSERTTRTLADVYSAIAPTFLAGVYVSRTDWASQHPDLLQRFNRTYIDATNYVNAHPSQTAPYVVELTGIELSQALKMRRTTNPTVLDTSQIQPLIDAAAKYEAIPRSFPAKELLASG